MIDDPSPMPGCKNAKWQNEISFQIYLEERETIDLYIQFRKFFLLKFQPVAFTLSKTLFYAARAGEMSENEEREKRKVSKIMLFFRKLTFFL